MEPDQRSAESAVLPNEDDSKTLPESQREQDEAAYRGSLRRARNRYGRTGAPPWESTDPIEVREFWKWMAAEGMRPETIRGWRNKLLRFFAWVHQTYGIQPVKANWKHVMAFKQMLFNSGLKKAGVNGYMDGIRSYYRYKAETTMENYWVNQFQKVRLAARVRDKKSDREKYRPLSWETVSSVLRSREALERDGMLEEWVLFVFLLYTAGRAQFYGLSWREVDLEGGWIHTITKRGKPITIPLHPDLAAILREWRLRQPTNTAQLFHLGRCPEDMPSLRDRIKAFETNARSAYKACKSIQHKLKLPEDLHPHRIRKSFATFAKKLNLDPQFAQKVTAHEEIEMLLDIYTHVDDQEAKDAYSRISFMNHDRANRSATARPADLIREVMSRLDPGALALVGPILNGVIEMLEGLPNGLMSARPPPPSVEQQR